MTMISAIENGLCAARIEALRSEFGATMAARIVESEEADFLWEARVRQRYLGQHIDACFPPDGEDMELSRIAILSVLDGRWHVAACLVDGEGQVSDLLWMQRFDDAEDAIAAFDRAA